MFINEIKKKFARRHLLIPLSLAFRLVCAKRSEKQNSIFLLNLFTSSVAKSPGIFRLAFSKPEIYELIFFFVIALQSEFSEDFHSKFICH